jgi:ribulose-phosphate 3-epimerase
MKKLAPSVLSADFGHLARDMDMINTSMADWIHVDVMDGIFVPNISFGFPVLKYLKSLAKKPLDVHLMIVEPDKYIEKFREYGAEIICVHYEACTHLHRSIQNIKESGAKAAVSLNPHTPVHVLENVIRDLDMVLIMSVNPGFAAQKFIPESLNKIKQCADLIRKKKSDTIIEVDGGVNLNNAKDLILAGADVLVAGNAVFASPDPIQTIKNFKKIMDQLS